VTPYRAAKVDDRAAIDPSRARFGLAGAALASLAVFVSVVHMMTHSGPSLFDGVLLYAGSATMALLLAYASLDAPAGRGVLFVSVAAFALSFVPQTIVRSLMSPWIWPARYLAIAGIASGLLLRMRRTRPGTYGVALRLAGALAAWWGLQWLVGALWADGMQSARSELFSRAIYLLLAAGMLDMRRFVGAVPERERERTPVDTAREIATTRICLAVVSLIASLSALPYAWHSEWSVIGAAEASALVVTVSFHVVWLVFAAPRTRVQPAIIAMAVLAFALGCRAFAARELAPVAALAAAMAELLADYAVARVAAPARAAEGRSAHRIAIAAMALHALNAAVIVARV
jgi:hypothetical protein